MGHTIETFNNVKGGNSFYKAISHPAVADKAKSLVGKLEKSGPIALYDPLGFFSGFDEFHDTSSINFKDAFVQNIEQVGDTVAGLTTKPIDCFNYRSFGALFIVAFDSERLKKQIRHLVAGNYPIHSLDEMRLDETWLTNTRHYLSAENFATNYAFFREKGGLSTRLSTVNYWSNYGAKAVTLNFLLFDESGSVIADWSEVVKEAGAAIIVDSTRVRREFGLPEFIGQLFIHVVGIKGHDIVKYALDINSSEEQITTCTHDANAWPSDFFAGLPAPRKGENVTLWLQNSHPSPISTGEVGINVMGDGQIIWLEEEIPPFGSLPLSVGDLIPEAEWPQQFEIRAGKHFVRPRYEITGGRTGRRMAHVNVEREDINPDPGITQAAAFMGKGFILPAPILPKELWRTTVLPTPMARSQENLPIAIVGYNPNGEEVGRFNFGLLPRRHKKTLEAAEFLSNSSYGHMELMYDFSVGQDVDGWLHALFRYENCSTGHCAETSFGSHIFNTVLTYRDEPQSYSQQAPGLSTRLFLRLGETGIETICHLIFPASTPWHKNSDTLLSLISSGGKKVSGTKIRIPCSGSRFFKISEFFTQADIDTAGEGAYIVVRDTTCRLFGYHGLLSPTGSFSFDHMFGF